MVDVIQGAPGTPLVEPSLQRKEPQKPTNPEVFQRILHQKIEEADYSLQFSSHAMQRLSSREIDLSSYDLTRIDGAVERAKAKGAKDSLVLLGDLAFVISVESKTVITALTGSSLRQRIFTNIDSAVIA